MSAVPRTRSLFVDWRITATNTAVKTISTTIAAQVSRACVVVAGDRRVVVRDQHDERGGDRAEELRDPVADQVVHRQPPVEEHRERDGRVEVPARDLAERVEAGEQREAEAERDRDEPGALRGERPPRRRSRTSRPRRA